MPLQFQPDGCNATWVPSPRRRWDHQACGSLRRMAIPSPDICIYGRVPISRLEIRQHALQAARRGQTSCPEATLPVVAMDRRLKSDSGARICENAAGFFFSIIHGNGQLWGINAQLAQPAGLLVSSDNVALLTLSLLSFNCTLFLFPCQVLPAAVFAT